MRWEKKGLHNRSAEISDLQTDELPFQEGAPLDLPKAEDKQDIEDLCREILMVRISEIQKLDDDSQERISLDDYHADDYDEYLSDNMDTSPITTTEIKASITKDPPFAPPTVTITIKLEDEQVEEDLYEHRRIHNQKRALRRQRIAERHQEHSGDSYDYSNSDLRNIINIGWDARSVIISERQEREEMEAYSPTSNYYISDAWDSASCLWVSVGTLSWLEGGVVQL